MYQSYYRLYETAVRAYTWENGQHWKVKVDQMTQGDGDFAKNFSEMIKEQMKPFLESNGAILPEFHGYEYSRIKGYHRKNDTRDIRALVEDIFDFTARSLNIPGSVGQR